MSLNTSMRRTIFAGARLESKATSRILSNTAGKSVFMPPVHEAHEHDLLDERVTGYTVESKATSRILSNTAWKSVFMPQSMRRMNMTFSASVSPVIRWSWGRLLKVSR
jgi:hypothetical protein